MSSQDFDVEFVDRDDREARFVVRNITPAFANGIRRAILVDVPTLSIDTVRFVENSSVMFDEQLGLRLGLVPLTTPEDYAAGEAVTLALDVEGPGTAYSGDLVSNDPEVEAADENIPIIELKDDQRLELEADAVMGHGRDHAKHQGGVAVGYRHLQRVHVVGDSPEYADDDPQMLRGVIEEDDELVPTDDFDNDLTTRYPGKEVEIEDVDGAFVFHVESDGSMPVEELVLRAVDTLVDRADELEQAVQL
ncbi:MULTISPECIES: DNA-directed RNA polymerase subunit D [Halobacterium]|uniref:DNA-directed RNA polymerase subunit Rpo3 n=5 Tax=Halobacterium salinarum TaxID=2242 RepID=RPO3_HALSA|nr:MULTISPECIES: DNA-directed RNA polymerase subunit D [Halobacterium]B0R4Y2.1 RecName: Full=DNA-directed RNA polymerase subunit Rpo3; AltName: Full=DNA-directed RNA polymerase subunit D [Halobacterium salinarum R1]Q9HQJ4.1 RecName: Full=DNA-directed RNA polymerase subunit Rpo3; AltName: Full=DNA-directed RNA polymerase subunit D [Halobacterium salinarum NRC-1]AAG19520.1 DNA-directed RNA polymerase II [Halobacterium salinarum NRC-1]MBB6090205.1 DNA-directed RNA polymerase subunit D [Halobacteri